MEILFSSTFAHIEAIILMIFGGAIAIIGLSYLYQYIARIIKIFWPNKRDAKLLARDMELLKKREESEEDSMQAPTEPEELPPPLTIEEIEQVETELLEKETTSGDIEAIENTEITQTEEVEWESKNTEDKKPENAENENYDDKEDGKQEIKEEVIEEKITEEIEADEPKEETEEIEADEPKEETEEIEADEPKEETEEIKKEETEEGIMEESTEKQEEESRTQEVEEESEIIQKIRTAELAESQNELTGGSAHALEREYIEEDEITDETLFEKGILEDVEAQNQALLAENEDAMIAENNEEILQKETPSEEGVSDTISETIKAEENTVPEELLEHPENATKTFDELEKDADKAFQKEGTSETNDDETPEIKKEEEKTPESEEVNSLSQKANETIKEIIDSPKKKADPHIEKLYELTNQSKTFMARGMITEARTTIIEGLSLRKNHRDLTLLLGETYEKEQNFEKAKIIYKDLAIEHTEDAEILQKLANILIIFREYSVAYELYKKILTLDADEENTLYMLVNIAKELEDFSDVYQYARTYLKQWPMDKDMLASLSEAQIILGKRKEAIETLIKYKNLSPYEASEIQQYIDQLVREENEAKHVISE